jgi:hypothetical protein
MDLAGDSLDRMTSELHIEPFRNRLQQKKLFLARFEFPKYGELFRYPRAIFVEPSSEVAGFVDFLAGFPIDCVELMMVVGQYSTKASLFSAKDASSIVAPVPEDLFRVVDMGKVIFNLTALPVRNRGKFMAENLSGEPKPHKLHWWYRINLNGGDVQFPVPGEFLVLAVRMMPDKVWGRQRSTPFMYSGNFMDTVYYSSGEVIEVDNSGEVPEYLVKWRGETYTMSPTDFAEYRVGDRVTILKDCAATKTSELWKDDDMREFGENWAIAPITFYGLDKEEAP